MARTFARPSSRTRIVRNRSSRRGVKPIRVVIHTTESPDLAGFRDLDGVAGWFDNPVAKASSHVITDSYGHALTCVPDDEKAWTQGSDNLDSLSIEQVGYASLPRWRWLKRTRQLKKGARFTAYWCRKYDIPVKRAVGHGPGIASHAQLSGPGGHSDPGAGFPWDRFLRYVTYYKKNGWRVGA